ncbi:hypothetical protein Y032_0112g302 [Ancylostoma ceylanicum]|uniref:Uncharacterized protein n=1 Tax=Ancylostoma ceylanicum TaxID=53326 RepID=A0A016TE12_9BILA|nr:hypothetical protein Y032_0112g302 [Ancylostoma ceylanicum]
MKLTTHVAIHANPSVRIYMSMSEGRAHVNVILLAVLAYANEDSTETKKSSVCQKRTAKPTLWSSSLLNRVREIISQILFALHDTPILQVDERFAPRDFESWPTTLHQK